MAHCKGPTDMRSVGNELFRGPGELEQENI